MTLHAITGALFEKVLKRATTFGEGDDSAVIVGEGVATWARAAVESNNSHEPCCSTLLHKYEYDTAALAVIRELQDTEHAETRSGADAKATLAGIFTPISVDVIGDVPQAQSS